MTIEQYMKEVVKENNDLQNIMVFGNYHVVNKERVLVINHNGDCNYNYWNNDWLYNNIKEFNDAGRGLVDVQKLFPNPQDFVKFYKKVRKEVENEK